MELTKYTNSTINGERIISVEYSNDVNLCMNMINQLNEDFEDFSLNLEYNGNIDYKLKTMSGAEYHAWQEFHDQSSLDVTNGDYHLCNMAASYLIDIQK